MLKEVVVPDIGTYSNVPVIEVAVSAGDVIEVETALITLETDKAAMEVPAPFSGTVKTVNVKVGDKVSQGSLILTVETQDNAISPAIETQAFKAETQPAAGKVTLASVQDKDKPLAYTKAVKEPTPNPVKEVLVPDIGAYSNVPVIEVAVSAGDVIEVETALITLETDKAAMEVPAPFSGTVKMVNVKVGDKVSQGNLILTVETQDNTTSPVTEIQVFKTETQPAAGKATLTDAQNKDKPISYTEAVKKSTRNRANDAVQSARSRGIVHAGPGVRRFARELGVDLTLVQGCGPKNRILKQDIHAYVKAALLRCQPGTGGNQGNFVVAPWPQIDFAKFGPITLEPLSRIKKLSGSFLHRNWVRVPHVTQFDEADITELEQFRKEQQLLAEQQGIKLTLLAFIIQAVVASLKAFPIFNASLDEGADAVVMKKYFHIGIAVDTANGLVVPVVKDAEEKGLFQLAKELADWGVRAREGLLTAQDMQGNSFTISSLGGVGGTAFTPIINVPDVAILGVSKAQMKPVYEEGAFKPRLLLPLSLSYDHRVIDGAQAARFITFLGKQLADIRQLLL
jgi:pyruvate dehydrogenase E2 component (dihydrolipoamide acetyltransferase)